MLRRSLRTTNNGVVASKSSIEQLRLPFPLEVLLLLDDDDEECCTVLTPKHADSRRCRHTFLPLFLFLGFSSLHLTPARTG